MAVKHRKENASTKTAKGRDGAKGSESITSSLSLSLQSKISIFIITIIIAGISFIAWNYIYEQQTEIVLSKVSDSVLNKEMIVDCANDYNDERSIYPQCAPTICKRVVTDDVVMPLAAKKLLDIAKKGFRFGGSDGGASILDLHSGALSKGDKFINIYSVQHEGEIFEEGDFTWYSIIKENIQRKIAEQFNIDKKYLYLTKPTFFSRITTAPARTIHDEYWHMHVDKETYGSFHYTSLLYLTDYGTDFTGGRFIFVDKEANVTVEPKGGRLSFFTSGSENPHFVEKLESGTRYAITVSFTCDPSKAIGDPKYKIS